MARLARRFGLLGTLVVTPLLAMAAAAWACTPHTGWVWFCPASNSNCAQPATGSPTQSFASGASAYMRGAGLYPSRTYELGYTSGPDLADTCLASALSFGTETTNSSGDFSAPKAVTMPSAPNTWTACIYFVAPSMAPNILQASNHRSFITT